jgi:hypothetical protein
MAPFYGRLPNVAGIGIESKVDVIGASLAAGAVAGVAAHAIATGVYQLRHRRAMEEAATAAATGTTRQEGGENG